MRPSTIAISADFVKPRALTHGLLEVVPGHPPWLLHARGRRLGGIYESLNCGVGSNDERALAFKNRARAMAPLGVAAGKAGDALPGARHRRRRRRCGLADGQGAARPTPWSPTAGHRASASATADCGPGALCRRRGARRRRRPCRLARGARRRFSNRPSPRWRGSAPSADSIVAVLGPIDLAAQLRGRAAT